MKTYYPGILNNPWFLWMFQVDDEPKRYWGNGWESPNIHLQLVWLVVSTHLENISQIGNLPQLSVNIKNPWHHHLVVVWSSRKESNLEAIFLQPPRAGWMRPSSPATWWKKHWDSHPGRLTWNLTITQLKRNIIWTKPSWLQVPAVNLAGCNGILRIVIVVVPHTKGIFANNMCFSKLGEKFLTIGSPKLNKTYLVRIPKIHNF